MKQRRGFRSLLFRSIMFFVSGVLAVSAVGAPSRGVVVSHDSESMRQFKWMSEKLDFDSWKGKTKVLYLRSLDSCELSDVHLATGKVDFVARFQKQGKNWTDVFVHSKDDDRSLFQVTITTLPDALTAQTKIAWDAGVSYKHPSNMFLVEDIGDRAYRVKVDGGYYIVFARNNIYASVISHSDYPVEPIARQIDTLILKRSRVPGKQWWYFFSR